MMRILKSGTALSMNPETQSSYIKDFEENHFIQLPRLLDDEILQDFKMQLSSGSWEERSHDGIGVEVCLADKGLMGLMNFLLNDENLFRWLQETTRCESIGSFEGRFYRMVPDAGHYDSWHTDITGHRLLALSINLSSEIYEGGTLQLRHQGQKEAFVEISNTGFGDAILFRIAPGLEHRVTPVTGSHPKTAFAGWFKNSPNFWDSLTRNLPVHP